MIKSGKRKYNEIAVPVPKIAEKKIRRQVMITEHFICSESLKTSLLTPSTLINLDAGENLFSKIIIRQIKGSSDVYFPNLTQEETQIFLGCIQEDFSNPLQEQKAKNRQEKKLSKKEEKIIAATNYLEEGSYSYQNIAKFTGLTVSEIWNLVKRIEREGSALPSKKGRMKKLQPIHSEFLNNILNNEKGTNITLKSLRTQILTQFDDLQNIHLSTIQKEIKGLGFSFKKAYKYPERRNNLEVKLKRETIVKELVYSLFEEYNIIFVDETSVHLNQSRSYGWAKKGEKLAIPTPPKSKNYSIIAGITVSRVLGCQIVKEGAKQEDFLGFLSLLVQHYNLMKNRKPIVFFVDNASIHTAKEVKSSLGLKVTVLYNAPHSPMLNPIEEFFSKFKNLIQKKLTRSEQELVVAVQESLTGFQETELRAYVRHTLSFVEKCLNREDII